GIEQLRALRKQLQERLSSALGLFEIVDIKWRAVALQQLAAEVTVDHGPQRKRSGQAFREPACELVSDRSFLHCPSQEMPPCAQTTSAPCDGAWQAENDRSMH